MKMSLCETHKNCHCPMCPVCMMQERDSLQAALTLLAEKYEAVNSELIRAKSTNETLKKIINYAGGSPPPIPLNYIDIFLPMEEKIKQLQADNKRLKEGIELYIVLKERQQFTPIETMRKIEKYLNKKVIGKGYLISSLIRDMKQSLKDKDVKEEKEES